MPRSRGRGRGRRRRGGTSRGASRSTSITKTSTRPSSRNINVNVFVKPEDSDESDQSLNASKRFKISELHNESIAQSITSTESSNTTTSSLLTTTSCLLCNRLLSKTVYHQNDDLNLDKCFDAFCTFLNITLSPELSFDFKIDNFPFCRNGCSQILSKLLKLYDILEETHFKVTDYVAKIKNIIGKLPAEAEAPSRINHIRESIKSQITEEDEHSLPFERHSGLKLEEQEEEETRFDFSDSSIHNTNGNNSEVGNVVQNDTLGEDSTHHASEDVLKNGNENREEENESVSTFETYLVAQLKLMDFIEASTKTVVTITENETDKEDTWDSSDKEDNNSSTEIGDSNNFQEEEENSVVEFEDISNQEDDSSTTKVDESNKSSNKDHAQEGNEMQVEDPSTSTVTVIGGRSLRSRASLKKKSYMEIEIDSEDDKNNDEDFKGDDVVEDEDDSGSDKDSNITHKVKNLNKTKWIGKRKTTDSNNKIQTLYCCSLCGWIGKLKTLTREHFKSFHLHKTLKKCHICSCYLSPGNEEDHVDIHINFMKLNQHQSLVKYDGLDSELTPSEFSTTLNNAPEESAVEYPPRCILCPHNLDSPLESQAVHERPKMGLFGDEHSKTNRINNQDHRKKYSCGKCGFRFPSKDNAVEHFKSCKLNDENIITCFVCKVDFSNLEEIQKHQETEHVTHEKMKHFSERYYSYLEDKEGNFIRESTRVISKEDLVCKLKCAICKDWVCDSVENRMNEFVQHCSGHEVDRPISCLECSVRVNSYNQAYIHFMLYHEKNMVYHCIYCTEVFPTLSLLSFHFSKSHLPVLGEKQQLEEGVDYIQDI